MAFSKVFALISAVPQRAFPIVFEGWAKMWRRRSGIFVAINFWDAVQNQPVTAIFNFAVVAISFFFAL